jgi:hypothetical protein
MHAHKGYHPLVLDLGNANKGTLAQLNLFQIKDIMLIGMYVDTPSSPIMVFDIGRNTNLNAQTIRGSHPYQGVPLFSTNTSFQTFDTPLYLIENHSGDINIINYEVVNPSTGSLATFNRLILLFACTFKHDIDTNDLTFTLQGYKSQHHQ